MGAQQTCHQCASAAVRTAARERCCGDEDLDDEPLAIDAVSIFAESDSRGIGSEPAGKVFTETLQGLSFLDRHLLIFAGSPCLAAVRWLLHLGARKDAADARGTSSLHAACREGTVAMVTELLRHKPLVDAQDEAGWTPLHVAAHMGRREVAARLIHARANPHRRTAKSRTAAELCMDFGTLEVLRAPYGALANLPGPPDLAGPTARRSRGESPEELADNVGIPMQCEVEVCFVDTKPVLRFPAGGQRPLLHVASQLFNAAPGQGLGLAVAGGLAESHAAAMRLLLRHGAVSRKTAGSFLGESLSVCSVVRLGVFDSLALLHTGVLSALSMAFAALRLPEDLSRIERLVRSLADVWWKQHRYFAQQGGVNGAPGSGEGAARAGELVGLELWQYLSGPGVLAQLMLSTVLLHWYVYNQREVSLDLWLALNQGIENSGADVPRHVLQSIFEGVQRRIVPELAIAAIDGFPTQALEEPQKDAALGPGLLSSLATCEGWLEVLGDSQELLIGSPAVRGGLSEATGRWEARDDPATESPSAGGRVLASLYCACLFFAVEDGTGRPAVPQALADVRHVRIAGAVAESQTLTLVGRGASGHDGPITAVRLLPDGRFHALRLQQLELRVPSAPELQSWVRTLVEVAALGIAKP